MSASALLRVTSHCGARTIYCASLSCTYLEEKLIRGPGVSHDSRRIFKMP